MFDPRAAQHPTHLGGLPTSIPPLSEPPIKPENSASELTSRNYYLRYLFYVNWLQPMGLVSN